MSTKAAADKIGTYSLLARLLCHVRSPDETVKCIRSDSLTPKPIIFPDVFTETFSAPDSLATSMDIFPN